MTLCFSSVIGWRFGWSSRVFLIPDLCGEGSVVPVARGWGGGNAPRDPKPNFHGKIEEANALRASGWTLSLLVLSLNRIGLVIISWTRLRPFFNLSWRAGQIKRAAVAAFGPRNLGHFFLFRGDFCFTLTLLVIVRRGGGRWRCWLWLMVYPSNAHAYTSAERVDEWCIGALETN